MNTYQKLMNDVVNQLEENFQYLRDIFPVKKHIGIKGMSPESVDFYRTLNSLKRSKFKIMYNRAIDNQYATIMKRVNMLSYKQLKILHDDIAYIKPNPEGLDTIMLSLNNILKVTT